MPLLIPTRQQVVQSGQAYFQTEVPEWNTSTSRRSWIGGLIKSMMSGLHDWYVALKQYADNQTMPQRATGTFLTDNWWTAITKLKPLPATPASGPVVVTGTAGTIISAGSVFTSNGLSYTADHDTTIFAQTISAASLTYSAGTCTFTSTVDHGLASGMTVTVAGAGDSAYNGAFLVIVLSANVFTYAPTGTPGSSPATGTITAQATFADINVTCTTTGISGNLDAGSQITAPSITGVNTTAYVAFAGVGGGSAIESDGAFRARVMQFLGTDFGTFSANEITIVAKQVAGVTRVWVRKAQVSPPSGWPSEGQVYVAFMRDNDLNPFPTPDEVTAVYNQIANSIMPANMAPTDLVVSSPTPQPVNFTFTALTPNSATMQAAIIANLQQFFSEGVTYGANVTQDSYRCAILNTYDPITQTALQSFTLSAPGGDVTVSATNLATLGTVSWPAI